MTRPIPVDDPIDGSEGGISERVLSMWLFGVLAAMVFGFLSGGC